MRSSDFPQRGFGSDPMTWAILLRRLPWIILVVFGLYLVWDSAYTLEAHEQGVVLRFGRHRATMGPGLHVKIPIIDKVVVVNTQEHLVNLPLSRVARVRSGQSDLSGDEDLMLTGDLNAAVVEWTLQWRVFEPEKYVFSIAQRDIETTIQAVAQSVMHRLVGDYSIDEMLTAKREEVTLAAERATQQVLETYDCGIRITGLQMQRVTPPAVVKPAFDQVNASLQNRAKLVNEANQERNKLLPASKAKKDQLIQEATGYADRRRAEAQGEISALLAKYKAYQQAPEITRRRLFLETMEEILASAESKTVLDANLKGLLPVLPLQPERRVVAPSSVPRQGGR